MPRDLDATAPRPGSRSTFLRAALIASCAVALAGCYAQPAQDIAAFAPTDVRMRHPIVIKEQDRTVELFIGNSRGGLTADQRADVLAFASAWRREATGGVIIEVPAGTSNAAAARGASGDAKSILRAAGVPANGIVVRSYKVADPARMALSEKVEVHHDAEITAKGAKFRHMVHVEAHLNDGTMMQRTVEAPRGSEKKFASESDIVEKFEKLAVKALPPSQVAQLRDAMLDLERLSDAAELARLLAKR